MKTYELATFIALALFGLGAVITGFKAGQDNPDAENILQARPAA